MLSHTRMGVPYEYTHMGRPIRVWANIRIWGRTAPTEARFIASPPAFDGLHDDIKLFVAIDVCTGSN